MPPYAPDATYPDTSEALEFAVRGLEVPPLVVLGHARCGGARALLQGAGGMNDFLAPWMSIAEAARSRTLACTDPNQDLLATCEREIVRLSIENLRSFPWIAERVAAGRLRLHGAYYGIASGVLEVMGADGAFAAVA